MGFRNALKRKGGELWLEFGFLGENSYQDMLWYNEGRARQIGYFIKHFIKNLFTPKRYYLMRYFGISIYLKG